jgi:hypothetical protein
MSDERKAHPLFIKRWAKLYVDRYVKEGADSAIEWAMAFFNKEDIKAVAEAARVEMKKRGRIVRPPPKDPT